MLRAPASAVLFAAMLGVAGCGGTPTAAAPAPTSPAAAAAPSVTELMARAGCRGKVIGTQLYSAETGRCTIAGGEVTVATFSDYKLRMEWVRAARQLGGKVHFGEDWAVWSPSRAATVFAAEIRP